MLKAFEGKKFNEMVAGGLAKMASMGTGAGPAVAAETKEEAKPVEEEKKEEEEVVDMGGLFGDDDDY